MNQAAIANNQRWFSEEKLQAIKDAQSDPNMVKMFRNPTNNKWEVWDETPLLPLGNTDWLDEHFGKTAFAQEHNVSLTGGNDKYDFYFSGNLLDQEGILRWGDDSQQRYTINAKINVNLTKWLTFGYSARWYRGKYDAPSFVSQYASNELYHNIARYWPIVPTHDPNGYPVVESFIDGMQNGGRYKKLGGQIRPAVRIPLPPARRPEHQCRVQLPHSAYQYFSGYSAGLRLGLRWQPLQA